MTIAEDVARANEVAANEHSPDWVELAPRLAASSDDAALDALLTLFVAERYCYDRPAKRALVTAVHPQTGRRLAERMVECAPDEERNLVTSHGAEVLARRGQRDVVDLLRAALDATPEDDAIVQRCVLVAMIALGAPEHARLRALFVEEEDDHILRDLQVHAAPSDFFECFAPLLESFQAQRGSPDEGPDHLFRLVPKVLFALSRGPDEPEDPALPNPEHLIDPRWYELALALRTRRPRPPMAYDLESLLERARREPPPGFTEWVARARETASRSRFLARLAGEHALIDGLIEKQRLDEEFVAQQDLRRAVQQGDEGWTLVTWAHKADDIRAIFERMGEELSGISFRGRGLPAAAVPKITPLLDTFRISRVDLSRNPLGQEGLLALLQSGHVAHVTHLDLSDIRVTGGSFGALGHTDALPALRSLQIAGEHGPKELASLLEGDALTAVTDLGLAGWKVDFARLVDSAAFQGMRRLHVTTTFEARPLLMRLESLVELSFQSAARNYSLRCDEYGPSALERLVLDFCHVHDSQGGIFQSPLLDTLTELSFEGAWFPAFDALLAREPKSLRRLSLRHVRTIDRDHLARLAAWPTLEQLEWLDLGGDTDLSPDDLQLLPESAREAVRATRWPD